MDWNRWIARFFDRRKIGLGEKDAKRMYGFFTYLHHSLDLPLAEFVFQFHNDLINSGGAEKEYKHLFEADGISLEVSVIRTEPCTDQNEIYIIELCCQNHTKGTEQKETVEFDFLPQAVFFIDLPMGLFAVCKKMIMDQNSAMGPWPEISTIFGISV